MEKEKKNYQSTQFHFTGALILVFLLRIGCQRDRKTQGLSGFVFQLPSCSDFRLQRSSRVLQPNTPSAVIIWVFPLVAALAYQHRNSRYHSLGLS
jgi:hypothetical protein